MLLGVSSLISSSVPNILIGMCLFAAHLVRFHAYFILDFTYTDFQLF